MKNECLEAFIWKGQIENISYQALPARNFKKVAPTTVRGFTAEIRQNTNV